MKDNQSPKPIYLKDYKAPSYLIDKTDLIFVLNESETFVRCRLRMRRNPEYSDCSDRRLVLHGGEDLCLKSLVLDGNEIPGDDYRVSEDTLEFDVAVDTFVLEIETVIVPQDNTRLEGLYKSNGMYCTQCEAEGFRHITYYLDRPDVMSVFSTRIEADKSLYPVLLSNGNKTASGELEGNRHWVTWEDPFKKPCYLFALVAGNLSVREDRFTTMSGREVLLQLFVESHDLDKCDHALLSLKNAMKWDEEVYGCEYDLDIYMIVAVSHFNMGAMENKGLNIFNTSCVLANPETTTDITYQRVEGVVAHEYFHNWSGNRVTCRDWFQLSLKEGFTVFRDEEFSSDMNSRTVKRIEDVNFLKTIQFAEDAGPLAHPVRPQSYIEMNNFYTSTVYHKGAEVVRMLHTLAGKEGFRKGTDLYFERFDGQAVTTDDFIAVMEEANGLNLSQFKRWYNQAGTPHITVSESYDESRKIYSLEIFQQCKPTPGQETKEAFYIPLKVALFNENEGMLDLNLKTGKSLNPTSHNREMVLIVDQASQIFEFANVESKPVPSFLRGFSAPVTLDFQYSKSQLGFLMQHDTDGFARWEAGQQLAQRCIKEQIVNFHNKQDISLDETLLEGFRSVLYDESLDKALRAKLLTLPSEIFLVGVFQPADVTAIHTVRQSLMRQLVTSLKDDFQRVFAENKFDEKYKPSAEQIAKRDLKNCCLHYLMLLNEDSINSVCMEQFSNASNMTDVSSALKALVYNGAPQAGEALDQFYEKWQHDSLVVDQWLTIQATSPQADCLQKVAALMEHSKFEITNPNKVRALIGAFCSSNLINFHNPDGSGYEFVSDIVLQLDALNPQTAARIVNPLSRWRQFDKVRSSRMVAALKRIKAHPDLSKDLYEIVNKSLA